MKIETIYHSFLLPDLNQKVPYLETLQFVNKIYFCVKFFIIFVGVNIFLFIQIKQYILRFTKSDLFGSNALQKLNKNIKKF